jgi:hypothetical protein
LRPFAWETSGGPSGYAPAPFSSPLRSDQMRIHNKLLHHTRLIPSDPGIQVLHSLQLRIGLSAHFQSPIHRLKSCLGHLIVPIATRAQNTTMPVELRKRKPHQEPAPAAAPKSKITKAPATKGKASAAAKVKVAEVVEKAAENVKAAVTSSPKPSASGTSGKGSAVGDVIDLDGFGGDIETNDGKKTSLKELLDESKAGVVLFTYPKASTPGCKSTPSSVYLMLTRDNLRHETGLLLPRCLRGPHDYRSEHLRSQQRFSQGQHQLQDEAEPALPASERHQG